MTEPADSWVVSHRERMRREGEAYFVPAASRVDIERKLNADERPRFVEEEGLYLGERPRVPAGVKNRLENRILHEHEGGGARAGERKDWFGRDGRLVALPDPVQRKPTRPTLYEDAPAPAVETVFCPPNLPPRGEAGAAAGTEHPGLVRPLTSGADDAGDAAERGAGGLAHCQLEVDVASVVFDHHHLFSLEHHLAVRLTEAFDSYQQVLSFLA